MMVRALSFTLPLLAAVAASGQPADLRLRQLDLALSSAEQQICSTVVMPPEWRDASDPVWFAKGATAKLDQHELWVGVLVPLVNVQISRGLPHLFVVGVPAETRVRFTPSGWRPRWPAC
jgi:hypothetical protein